MKKIYFIAFFSMMMFFVLMGNENVRAEGEMGVYRLYNPYSQEHLYTTDQNEVYVLSSLYGWRDEGIFWYAPGSGDGVYRLYFPGGFHVYTNDRNEIDFLTAHGWRQDGTGAPVFYSGGDHNVYRTYHPLAGYHLLTSDGNEYETLSTRGWNKEGAAIRAVSLPERLSPPGEPDPEPVAPPVVQSVPVTDIGVCNSFAGAGDYVTPFFTNSATGCTLTHDGGRNFIVWLYYGKDRQLLINGIGPYNGTERVDIRGRQSYMVIRADGNWSINFE